MHNKGWFVYIVECADNTLYTGITTDLERRILEHNSKDRGAKYTRYKQPVKLVYFEYADSRSTASKREYEIKKFSRKCKIELIIQFKGYQCKPN